MEKLYFDVDFYFSTREEQAVFFNDPYYLKAVQEIFPDIDYRMSRKKHKIPKSYLSLELWKTQKNFLLKKSREWLKYIGFLCKSSCPDSIVTKINDISKIYEKVAEKLCWDRKRFKSPINIRLWMIVRNKLKHMDESLLEEVHFAYTYNRSLANEGVQLTELQCSMEEQSDESGIEEDTDFEDCNDAFLDNAENLSDNDTFLSMGRSEGESGAAFSVDDENRICSEDSVIFYESANEDLDETCCSEGSFISELYDGKEVVIEGNVILLKFAEVNYAIATQAVDSFLQSSRNHFLNLSDVGINIDDYSELWEKIENSYKNNNITEAVQQMRVLHDLLYIHD